MTESPYNLLAQALDRLPNGYPKTESGVELRILEMIFSPEEAALAAHLGEAPVMASEAAEQAGMDASEAVQLLREMAKRSLVWGWRQDNRMVFRLAPFVVGFYEETMMAHPSHELARLVEAYFAEAGSALLGPQPALHRVVPAQEAIEPEWVLPYDDVKKVLLESKSFYVRDCVCRVERQLEGHDCHFPTRMCMSFSNDENAFGDQAISQAEALALLDKSEEVGLVHTVSNWAGGISYICNCCGCCCGILRGVTEFGVVNAVAYANYVAVVDETLCRGCAVCEERCQVTAITVVDGISQVTAPRCIGCGLCVTGCPEHALSLVRKPEAEIVAPPTDYGDWSIQRRTNRGLV
jgi:ferredoxin